MSAALRFSVATPTRNNLDKLKRCVGSIRGQQSVSWLRAAVAVAAAVVFALFGGVDGTAMKSVLVDGTFIGVAAVAWFFALDCNERLFICSSPSAMLTRLNPQKTSSICVKEVT